MLTMSWGQLKALVKSELDLDEETFIDDTELMNYANRAIDEAEQLVMSIYQDYFRTKYSPPLVNGTSEYVMPTDIYANKIRFIQYSNGSKKYKVNRIKTAEIAHVNSGDDYLFDIEHKASTGSSDPGIRFVLYPASRETGTPMTIWYIRNATRLVDDNSAIDVPEAINFMRQYIAVMVFRKELHPLLQASEADLERQRVMLKETLDQMAPDDYELIDQDMSFYEDFANEMNGDY